MSKNLISGASSAILGPVERHLKYPKTTLASGIAVVAVIGMGLASTEIPREGSSDSAVAAQGQEYTTPLDSKPRISAGLSDVDWWACDPRRGPSYVGVDVFSAYPEDQPKFAADDPAMWTWVTGVIRSKIEGDPFIDEYRVNVKVQYDDPNGAAVAQGQAHHIESLASAHLDMPEGNPTGEGNAIIEHASQDMVTISALRQTICPN